MVEISLKYSPRQPRRGRSDVTCQWAHGLSFNRPSQASTIEDIASGRYGDYSVTSINHELTTMQVSRPYHRHIITRPGLRESHALIVKARQALLAGVDVPQAHN